MEFDLSTTVDSLDKVPEQFRPIFAPTAADPAKFAVDPKFVGVREAILGFDKSNKTLRDQIKTTKVVDLTPLSEFGATPEEIKAKFEARVADLTAKGGDAAKAVEKVRGEMATAHETALRVQTAKNEALQNQLYTILVENEATVAVAEHKGIVELLMPFLKNQIKVVERDGQFIRQVIDEKGEERYSTVTGRPMTVKELVATMKTDPKYGRLFESDNQAGGGGFLPNGQRPAPTQRPNPTANGKIAAGLAKRHPGRA